MLPITGEELLRCYDTVSGVDRGRFATLDSLSVAADIQDEIVSARLARGEEKLGYKIGFTNRTIWARYGVTHPIWGPMYKSTVQQLDSNHGVIDPARFVEPRLEPEIVIGLAATPAEATPAAVASCVQWVAHGFEIVQSHYADWQFTGAESFAAQGLHGALLIGPRVQPDELTVNRAELPAMLAGIAVDLFVDGNTEPVDTGVGSNVLDGPLHAVAYLIAELAKRGLALQAGDIITTGTITDAQPIVLGQQWHTELKSAGKLADMHLKVEASAH